MKPKLRGEHVSNQISVKIDREHYALVVQAARTGTRSVAHQLRLIFETYFNGGKQ